LCLYACVFVCVCVFVCLCVFAATGQEGVDLEGAF